MADTFQLIGKTDGRIVYQSGLRNFNADWGGAFTAFEIANMMTKLPKVTAGTSEVPFRRVGTIVEKTNLRMWIERLGLTLWGLQLNNMLINATDVKKLWVDKILPSQSIIFAGHRDDPAKPVADALIQMGLNRWGVVQELTKALTEFEAQAKGGTHSAVVHITV